MFSEKLRSRNEISRMIQQNGNQAKYILDNKIL